MSAPVSHTPGPWDYSGGDIISRAPEFTGRFNKRKVAAVSLAYKDSITFFANMNLIAAAPDLLAELIALRTRFHNAVRAGGSDEEYVLLSTPGADAAISRATGTQGEGM